MKKLNITTQILLIFILLNLRGTVFGQSVTCHPYIKIDGNSVPANSFSADGLTLPLWLKAGQTLAPSTLVNSISVIEFSIVGNALQFSQVLNINTLSTVPLGTVWKIESLIKQQPAGITGSVTYTPGSYTFTVPSGINIVYTYVWGAGGGGGGTPGNQFLGGGGGGGGGYGAQCFSVIPGATLSVTVGSGGTSAASSSGTTGGSSSISGTNVSIGATGGGGGAVAIGIGGAGGVSNASNNGTGGGGQTGSASFSGAGGQGGGSGGLGGAGASGTSSFVGNAGSVPGGGGGGAWNATGTSTARTGGTGGNGQVIIAW